jgi:hypothetical protein
MLVFLLILAALAVIAIAGTLVETLLDGYGTPAIRTHQVARRA